MGNNKGILCILLLIIIFSSCRKFDNPPAIFEEEPELVKAKQRKVLIISIDDLSGLELENYMPTNMSSLIENAKYTLDGFSDGETGDASTWTTIVSGISSTQHGIHGNSFEEEIDEDDPHGHNSSGSSKGYISVFQRILESGKAYESFSVTSMDILDKNVFSYSDYRIQTTSDEQVKNVTIDTLMSNNEKISLGVVHFRSVNDAGLASGFKMSNPDYKTALDVVDGYIGEIMETIHNRPNYEHEDWLIIITSNHGGIDNTYGGSSFEERKIPIIFHNKKFKKYRYVSPDLVNSLLINTKGNVQTPIITAANSDLYDLKGNTDYTIMFKVKNRVLPGGTSHTVILGRTTHAYSSNRGWHFMVEGSNTGRYRALLGDGGAQLQVIGKQAKLNEWESLALKVYYKSDGQRYATFYVDGVAGTEVAIPANRANFQTTAANFFIGSGNVASIGTFNGTVNDLVFIPKAISDEEIQAFTCMDKVDESVSFWNDLTGYWPMKEGAGTKISNLKPTSPNSDFLFNGSTYTWQLESNWSCNPSENKKNLVLINQYDIFPQIVYWLNINAEDSWKLEGDLFLDDFESEFLID